MNVDISAVKFELTQSLKDYTIEKVTHLERFSDDKITEIKVVLEVDDGHHRHGRINGCEIIVNVSGQKDVFVKSWTDEMHKSINEASDEAEREFKRIKEKNSDLDRNELREKKGYKE